MMTTFDEAKLEAILSRVLTSAKPAAPIDFDFQSGDEGKEEELEELRDADEMSDEASDDSVEFLEPLDDDDSGNGYDIEEFIDDDTDIPSPDEEHYDGVEELEGIDELEKLPAAPDAKGGSGDISLDVYSPKNLWTAIYDEDTDTTPEDDAWRKLAEETAAMEPSEIWEELAVKTETEEILETTDSADNADDADKNTGLLDGDILEEDPFLNAVTDALSGNAGELADVEEAGYGEFIPEAAEAAKDTEAAPPDPVFSMDPLYNVEEFAEADDDRVPDGILRHETKKAGAAPPAVAVKTPVKARDASRQKAVKPAVMTNAAPPSYFQFFPQDSTELEFLEAADGEEAANGEETVIKNRNGVDYIDAAALKAASAEAKKVDPKMKNLVDSVLRKT
jgi:hypothetical protein